MRISVFLVSVLLTCAASASFANPLILAPTGTTLGTGQFRAEAAFSPNNDEGRYFWFGAGLAQVEANVIRRDMPGAEAENLFGLQWNFLPETFATPALAFGGTDLASESGEGIGVYVAATKKLGLSKYVPFVKQVSGTIGIGAGGIRGPFASLEAKLPLRLFVQGEYDSRNLNAAVGWQPAKMFRVKAYGIDGDLYLGAELLPISF